MIAKVNGTSITPPYNILKNVRTLLSHTATATFPVLARWDDVFAWHKTNMRLTRSSLGPLLRSLGHLFSLASLPTPHNCSWCSMICSEVGNTSSNLWHSTASTEPNSPNATAPTSWTDECDPGLWPQAGMVAFFPPTRSDGLAREFLRSTCHRSSSVVPVC